MRPRSLRETELIKFPFSIRRRIFKLILKSVMGTLPVCFVPLSAQMYQNYHLHLNCSSERLRESLLIFIFLPNNYSIPKVIVDARYIFFNPAWLCKIGVNRVFGSLQVTSDERPPGLLPAPPTCPLTATAAATVVRLAKLLQVKAERLSNKKQR